MNKITLAIGQGLLVCLAVACSGASENSGAGDTPDLPGTISALETAMAGTPTRAPDSVLPTVRSTSGDTPAGTVLDSGQTWRADDLELTLTAQELFPDMVRAYFLLRNTGDKERVLEYGPDNFAAADNLGRSLTIGGVSYNFRPVLQAGCSSRSLVLTAGQDHDITFSCRAGTWAGVAVSADLTDTSLTEVVIVASGISALENARWRIPIYH